MSYSVLTPSQGDSQPNNSSICAFCERILLFNGKSSIAPHQPDVIALGCSARTCSLCKLINKHLLASARREIGRSWLQRLRNSELGESSSLTASIRLVSEIPASGLVGAPVLGSFTHLTSVSVLFGLLVCLRLCW